VAGDVLGRAVSIAREVWRRVVHTAHELFIAVDQLANVLIFAFNLGTYADETLSARAWRQSRNGHPQRWVIFRVTVNVLFSWQDVYLRCRTGEWPTMRHCERAYESELARMGLHPEYRQPKEAQ